MNLRNLLLIICLSGTINPLSSQIDLKAKKELINAPRQYKLAFFISESGDTIPVVNLRLVNISEERTFSSQKEKRQWSKLKRDVAKVYPYSKLASKKLKEYNTRMEGLTSSQQKKLLKQAEKELLSEFEDDIRGMTINQGRILIKLIDRETGNTSYALVEDLRGTFQAFFWQSIARIFSTNLKSAYSPHQNKEDRLIEDIITSIEDGTFVN
jgi:hypothetical protein